MATREPIFATVRFPGGAPMIRTALSTITLAVLLILLGTAPASAASQGSTYYQCTINISAGTNDCLNNIVTVTSTSGVQRVARVDLASSGYLRLDAFVDVCNPTGYWAHFADSPTCNGGGGDGATSEHDAEAYNYGTEFQGFGTYNAGRGGLDVIHVSQGVAAATGCYRVQWTIYEDRAIYDDDANPADAPRVELRSIHMFESAPYAEPDAEDPTSADANRWYVGLNRTVGTSARSGTGATKACFVVSTTTAPTPSLLTSLCP